MRGRKRTAKAKGSFEGWAPKQGKEGIQLSNHQDAVIHRSSYNSSVLFSTVGTYWTTVAPLT